MSELKWISVSSVIGTVLQPRLQEDRELDGLTESILQGGMNTPVTVLRPPASSKPAGKATTKKKTGARAKPGQLYLMRSGHRRRAAVLKLVKRGIQKLPPGHARVVKGEAHLEAVIVDGATGQEQAVAALIDNVEREPLTPYEQACAVKKLAEELKVDRDDLARRVRIHPDSVDYMIAALSPKNLTLKMIQSWKEQQLVLGHIQTLMRLKAYRPRQKKLYTKIIKEQLTVTQARFWCNQLLEQGDIPLERRTNVLIAERLLNNPLLRELIENKQLNVADSVHGDQVTIKVDGPKKLREAFLAGAAALKGLDL